MGVGESWAWSPIEGWRYHTFAHTEYASVAIFNLSDRMHRICGVYAKHMHNTATRSYGKWTPTRSKREYIVVVKRLICRCICAAYAKLTQTQCSLFSYNSKCIYIAYAKHIQTPSLAYYIWILVKCMDYEYAKHMQYIYTAYANIVRVYKRVPRTGRTPPLSKIVRNREYLHLIQPYNFSPKSPLSMASICSNYSLVSRGEV